MVRLYPRHKLAKSSMLSLAWGFLACALQVPAMAQSSVLMIVEDARVFQVVADYVAETRAWPKDAYRIEYDRRDGDILSISVIHRDDEAAWAFEPTPGGGGKSFAVDVDAKSQRVIRELAFQ